MRESLAYSRVVMKRPPNAAAELPVDRTGISASFFLTLLKAIAQLLLYGRLPASERRKVRFGEHFLRWLARPSPAKVLGRFAVPEDLRRKGVGVRRMSAGPESSQVFGRNPSTAQFFAALIFAH